MQCPPPPPPAVDIDVAVGARGGEAGGGLTQRDSQAVGEGQLGGGGAVGDAGEVLEIITKKHSEVFERYLHHNVFRASQVCQEWQQLWPLFSTEP